MTDPTSQPQQPQQQPQHPQGQYPQQPPAAPQQHQAPPTQQHPIYQQQQQQQQSGYPGQPSGYLPQAPAAPGLLTKIGVDAVTLGLATGGLFALFVTQIFGGVIGTEMSLGSSILNPLYVMIALVAVIMMVPALAKLKGLFITVAAAIAVLEIGNAFAMILRAADHNSEAGPIIAFFLYIIGVGLIATAAFTAKAPTAAAPAQSQHPGAQQQQGWQQ